MKAVQLDIYGNDVLPVDKRKTYRLELYYGDSYAGSKEIKAYSVKQAKFLFYNASRTNRQYDITDIYEVK